MITVIIPVALLLSIILIKKIPYIGGKITIGLLVTGFAALVTAGVYNPLEWFMAWIDGLDRISWVLGLIIFGSIYAESQVKLGTIEVVLNSLRARFGHSPRGLIITVLITLVIAGSLLGEAIASATIIGVLVVTSLHELGLKDEQISATIVMGACLGSVMPPISAGFFLASSLMDLPSPDPVIQVGYITIGMGVILCSIYVSKFFVKIDALPEELIPKKKAHQIMIEDWQSLVPLTVLIGIVILKAGFKINLLDIFDPIFVHIKSVTILKGLNYYIVKALILCTIISYFFGSVRKNSAEVIKQGLNNVKGSLIILTCAAFMIGAFWAGGQIDTVQAFAQGLSANLLKLGGTVAMTLIGMLTGSMTVTQTSIFTFFGPALQAIGLDPVNVAVAGAHLGMAGQGLPPSCLTTFVVAGIVGSILGTKVDPVRSMIYSSVMCFYFLIVGSIFLFI